MAAPVLDHLARIHQLLLGVLADAAEQAIPGGAVLLLDDDQVAGHQMVEEVEHVEGIEGVAGRDGLGRLERPSATEDSEAAEERAFVLGQELVAPVDGGAQRLLAGHRRAIAAGEETELIAEAVEDLGRREHVDARRRQLDGQRYAVETPADVGHGVAVVVGEREGAVAKPGAVGEQLHTLSRRHGRDTQHDLARQAERFLAGGHHLHAATGLQQQIGQLGAAGEHVLAIVENEQQLFGRQRLSQRGLEMTT